MQFYKGVGVPRIFSLNKSFENGPRESEGYPWMTYSKECNRGKDLFMDWLVFTESLKEVLVVFVDPWLKQWEGIGKNLSRL